MILPVRNATLLSIAGGGTSEDFDQAAGAPVAKWEGREDVTHKQEVLDVTTGGGGGAALDEIVRTRLVFDGDLADVVPGDTLTYEHGGQTHTRKAKSVSEPDVLGVVQVNLEPA